MYCEAACEINTSTHSPATNTTDDKPNNSALHFIRLSQFISQHLGRVDILLLLPQETLESPEEVPKTEFLLEKLGFSFTALI